MRQIENQVRKGGSGFKKGYGGNAGRSKEVLPFNLELDPMVNGLQKKRGMPHVQSQSHLGGNQKGPYGRQVYRYERSGEMKQKKVGGVVYN